MVGDDPHGPFLAVPAKRICRLNVNNMVSTKVGILRRDWQRVPDKCCNMSEGSCCMRFPVLLVPELLVWAGMGVGINLHQ